MHTLRTQLSILILSLLVTLSFQSIDPVILPQTFTTVHNPIIVEFNCREIGYTLLVENSSGIFENNQQSWSQVLYQSSAFNVSCVNGVMDSQVISVTFDVKIRNPLPPIVTPEGQNGILMEGPVTIEISQSPNETLDVWSQLEVYYSPSKEGKGPFFKYEMPISLLDGKVTYFSTKTVKRYPNGMAFESQVVLHMFNVSKQCTMPQPNIQQGLIQMQVPQLSFSSPGAFIFISIDGHTFEKSDKTPLLGDYSNHTIRAYATGSECYRSETFEGLCKY